MYLLLLLLIQDLCFCLTLVDYLILFNVEMVSELTTTSRKADTVLDFVTKINICNTPGS